MRLAISVEGPTEYEFCREILRPHLQTFDVQAEAKIIVTKRNIVGSNAKGGSVSLERVINEVRPLLHSFDYVTTLYDFYGFKGREPGESPVSLSERIATSLDNARNFLPYLQVYEFEALLFSSPAVIGRFLCNGPIVVDLQQAVEECGGTEQVNDSPDTAPSRRLETAFITHLGQRYDKKFHGPLLLMDIGLPAARGACPRFDGWLTQLEKLAEM